MVIAGLLIPDLLETMLAEGRWPRTADEALKQNLHSRVPEDRNRRLRRIYLYAPPFHTVAQIVAGNGGDFYSRFGALHDLVPEASVEIADFGIKRGDLGRRDIRRIAYDDVERLSEAAGPVTHGKTRPILKTENGRVLARNGKRGFADVDAKPARFGPRA